MEQIWGESDFTCHFAPMHYAQDVRIPMVVRRKKFVGLFVLFSKVEQNRASGVCAYVLWLFSLSLSVSGKAQSCALPFEGIHESGHAIFTVHNLEVVGHTYVTAGIVSHNVSAPAIVSVGFFEPHSAPLPEGPYVVHHLRGKSNVRRNDVPRNTVEMVLDRLTRTIVETDPKAVESLRRRLETRGFETDPSLFPTVVKVGELYLIAKNHQVVDAMKLLGEYTIPVRLHLEYRAEESFSHKNAAILAALASPSFSQEEKRELKTHLDRDRFDVGPNTSFGSPYIWRNVVLLEAEYNRLLSEGLAATHNKLPNVMEVFFAEKRLKKKARRDHEIPLPGFVPVEFAVSHHVSLAIFRLRIRFRGHDSDQSAGLGRPGEINTLSQEEHRKLYRLAQAPAGQGTFGVHFQNRERPSPRNQADIIYGDNVQFGNELLNWEDYTLRAVMEAFPKVNKEDVEEVVLLRNQRALSGVIKLDASALADDVRRVHTLANRAYGRRLPIRGYLAFKRDGYYYVIRAAYNPVLIPE